MSAITKPAPALSGIITSLHSSLTTELAVEPPNDVVHEGKWIQSVVSGHTVNVEPNRMVIEEEAKETARCSNASCHLTRRPQL